MSEARSPARPVLPSEQRDNVSLREFEQRLSDLQNLMDERTRYEREILSTRENLMKEAIAERELALQKALELQAEEYERRLAELNHSHQEAIQNWRTSLPREIFDANWQEFRSWRDKVNTELTNNSQLPTALGALARRVDEVENHIQNAQGALTLIRLMGFAGVLALLVSLARMAGWGEVPTP